MDRRFWRKNREDGDGDSLVPRGGDGASLVPGGGDGAAVRPEGRTAVSERVQALRPAGGLHGDGYGSTGGGLYGTAAGEADPAMQAALLGAEPQATPEALHQVDSKRLAYAAETLKRYKDGKVNLERRIVEDEQWWQLRHWDAIRRGKRAGSDCPEKAAAPQPEPASAWLFNAIVNKHADAMDNYPEPVVLPREQSDEESARALSAVLPVILEYNEFETVYSRNWYEKLKHGTAVYGVFWNSRKDNGLGDVDIREIDLLKLFWEPGITDIQDSRNLFLVELTDTDLLEQQYPQFKGRLGGQTIDVKQYIYDDTVDTADKSVVVDWYYKLQAPGGRTVLHYAKFVGDCLLYASEEDPNYRDRGWYDDGKYPIVLDVLYPEKGTPVGFGYVAICKDPQLYIDKLGANILENAMMGTKKRFFASSSTGVNEAEFLDWNQPIVHVEGELDDRRLKEIEVRPLDSIYAEVLQMKVEEMKDTASNRDVNSGAAGSGVTAAAAIAALQEAGNKVSRDMISASYRAHVAINAMVIDRMAQFYDEARVFRVTGDAPGSYRFAALSNQGLREQQIGVATDGTPLFRKPIFDLKIKAQKKNPFSRMEQNERAKELYGMGFFNPERAQEALGALEMMEFEGKDKVVEYARNGQTLLNVCQQLTEQMNRMALLLQTMTGRDMGIAGETGTATGGASAPASAPAGGGSSLTDGVMAAQTPMTDYGTRLAKRSVPDMGGTA